MRCAATPQNCTSAAGLCSSFRPRRKATTRKENRQRRPAELGSLGSEFDPDLIRHCTAHLAGVHAVRTWSKVQSASPSELRTLGKRGEPARSANSPIVQQSRWMDVGGSDM